MVDWRQAKTAGSGIPIWFKPDWTRTLKFFSWQIISDHKNTQPSQRPGVLLCELTMETFFDAYLQ